MERFQSTPRLVLALLVVLGLAGLGQATFAQAAVPLPGGELQAPDGSPVPGIVAAPAQAPHFLAVTGRIEAVEKSFLLRRTEKVGIDVPTIGTLLIDDAGKGEELKEHVGDLVTLIATPKLLQDGKLVLAVQAYEIRQLRSS